MEEAVLKDTYLIRRGRHSCCHWPEFHWGTTSETYEAILPHSLLYITDDDYGKLCGFSYGHHHRHSFRIGFGKRKQHIVLVAYMYVRGKRIMIPLQKIKTNNKFALYVRVHSGLATIRISEFGKTTEHIVPFPSSPYPGYYLFPYYGGDQPASRNHHIYLKRYG